MAPPINFTCNWSPLCYIPGSVRPSLACSTQPCRRGWLPVCQRPFIFTYNFGWIFVNLDVFWLDFSDSCVSLVMVDAKTSFASRWIGDTIYVRFCHEICICDLGRCVRWTLKYFFAVRAVIRYQICSIFSSKIVKLQLFYKLRAYARDLL
jgi:hypothetical protein